LRRKNCCYSEFVVIVNAGHAGLFLNGLAKDKISVGCAGCDWKKAGMEENVKVGLL
jgi:hypothetical protein